MRPCRLNGGEGPVHRHENVKTSTFFLFRFSPSVGVGSRSRSPLTVPFPCFAMPLTTPLLRLLDAVISQDDAQIEPATNAVRQTLLPFICIPELITTANLAEVIRLVLRHYPSLASASSIQDGSLPLHFAASLGNVGVASVLYSMVRMHLTAVDFTPISRCSLTQVSILSVPTSCCYSQQEGQNSSPLRSKRGSNGYGPILASSQSLHG
jgi:hypothetical protein